MRENRSKAAGTDRPADDDEAIAAHWEKRVLEMLGADHDLILRAEVPKLVRACKKSLEEPKIDSASTAADAIQTVVSDLEQRRVSDSRAVRQLLTEFTVLGELLKDGSTSPAGMEEAEAEALVELLKRSALELALTITCRLQESQEERLGSRAHDIRNQLFVASGHLYLIRSGNVGDPGIMIERLENELLGALDMLKAAGI